MDWQVTRNGQGRCPGNVTGEVRRKEYTDTRLTEGPEVQFRVIDGEVSPEGLRGRQEQG